MDAYALGEKEQCSWPRGPQAEPFCSPLSGGLGAAQRKLFLWPWASSCAEAIPGGAGCPGQGDWGPECRPRPALRVSLTQHGREQCDHLMPCTYHSQTLPSLSTLWVPHPPWPQPLVNRLSPKQWSVLRDAASPNSTEYIMYHSHWILEPIPTHSCPTLMST